MVVVEERVVVQRVVESEMGPAIGSGKGDMVVVEVEVGVVVEVCERREVEAKGAVPMIETDEEVKEEEEEREERESEGEREETTEGRKERKGGREEGRAPWEEGRVEEMYKERREED